MWQPRAAILAIGIALSSAFGGPVRASAQTSMEDEPTWDVDLRVDFTATLVAGMVSVGWLLANELGPGWCAPLCDPDEVNFFDRWAAGLYSEAMAVVSDLALGGGLLLNASVLVAEEGIVNALTDGLVVLEAMFFTNMLAILSGLASRRPRPYVYSTEAPEEERMEGVSSVSFFSGHVGSVAAVTVATFQTLRERDRGSSVPWVLLATGSTVTLIAGVARVLSGNHFPSDVLIGIATGVCMGLLFPALHDRP